MTSPWRASSTRWEPRCPDIAKVGASGRHLQRRLGDVSFPTRLSRREDVLRAAGALAAAGDGYLVVEGGPRDLYYVHAIGCRAKGHVTVEALGNPYLPAELRRPRAKLAELRRDGWRRQGDRQGNYRRCVSLASPADAARIMTELVCATLTKVYGLEPDSQVTICLALD